AGIGDSLVDDSDDVENGDSGSSPGPEVEVEEQFSPISVSSVSCSLLSLSLLTLLSGVDGSGDQGQANSTGIATTNSTGASSVTTSAMITTTTVSTHEDDSFTAGAILAMIVAVIIVVFLGVTCSTYIMQAARRVGILNVRRERQEGNHHGEHVVEDGILGAFGNGGVVRGARGPDDGPDEIMELGQPLWGWGYIPGEVEMVVMGGGAQDGGGEEEEEEDAV
ncbi:hypothetical protein, partial [Candidatus Ichthyocystis sparus]|uniref:hypothetical protein n=1 Tax=Candidatus Ichthyocystis sparus TaxID=1561004 RepID=UPI00159EE5A8